MSEQNKQTFTEENSPEIISEIESISEAVDLYPPNSMRNNFSWILAGNVVTQLSLAGVLILLAKFGSAALQGRFLLCLGIVFPIAVFYPWV